MVDVYVYFPSTLSGMTSSLGRKVIGESVLYQLSSVQHDFDLPILLKILFSRI